MNLFFVILIVIFGGFKMDRTEVFNKVVGIVTPFCKNTEMLKNIKDETRFLDDLHINSARLVDIILAVEDNFGVEVDDDTADSMRTVGDAVNFVLSKA